MISHAFSFEMKQNYHKIFQLFMCGVWRKWRSYLTL